MFYKLILDEYGDYVLPDGRRCCVAAARRMRNRQGMNVGYEEFPSLEEAVRAWNLILFNRFNNT